MVGRVLWVRIVSSTVEGGRVRRVYFIELGEGLVRWRGELRVS